MAFLQKVSLWNFIRNNPRLFSACRRKKIVITVASFIIINFRITLKPIPYHDHHSDSHGGGEGGRSQGSQNDHRVVLFHVHKNLHVHDFYRVMHSCDRVCKNLDFRWIPREHIHPHDRHGFYASVHRGYSLHDRRAE